MAGSWVIRLHQRCPAGRDRLARPIDELQDDGAEHACPMRCYRSITPAVRSRLRRISSSYRVFLRWFALSRLKNPAMYSMMSRYLTTASRRAG